MYFYASKLISPLIFPSNFILLSIIILIFLKKKNIAKYFLCAFFIISIFPVGKLLNYNILSKDYYGLNENTNFDSILILGGDNNRILHALELWNKNENKMILFAGGSYYLNSNYLKKNSESKDFEKVIKNFISTDNFVILESRNTIENFQQFKKYISKNSLQNTLLVTSPWHYRRSMLIAKDLNLQFNVYKHTLKKKNNSLLPRF